MILHEKNMRQNCGIKYFHKRARLRGRPASSCHVYVHLGKWDTPVVSRRLGKWTIFLKISNITTPGIMRTGIVIARGWGKGGGTPFIHRVSCGRLILNRIYLIRRDVFISHVYMQDKMGIGYAERATPMLMLLTHKVISVFVYFRLLNQIGKSRMVCRI